MLREHPSFADVRFWHLADVVLSFYTSAFRAKADTAAPRIDVA